MSTDSFEIVHTLESCLVVPGWDFIFWGFLASASPMRILLTSLCRGPAKSLYSDMFGLSWTPTHELWTDHHMPSRFSELFKLPHQNACFVTDEFLWHSANDFSTAFLNCFSIGSFLMKDRLMSPSIPSAVRRWLASAFLSFRAVILDSIFRNNLHLYLSTWNRPVSSISDLEITHSICYCFLLRTI